ncbi:hypothetical protein CcaverHIS631_0105370 [Cutaneotrichosporon cavernicola]|nr:hypothetical protein CcaverHIS631_0105370 [Cutaneotrichosporon cavernicola]BEJ03362.1 hypothetical protein CcaverHIS641_0105370 [Cutaneotrichosporon cavernicola]
MSYNGKPAEMFWKPGDARPHSDEEPFMDKFRQAANKRYGVNLKDYWEFHTWSVKEHAKFMDLAWDYLGLIGERGDGPAFIPGVPMDQEQPYFPTARINVAENLLLAHKSALSKTKYAMIATVEGDPASGSKEPKETRRISYYELYHEVRKASHALRKMGVKPGESVVSFAATNCEMLVVFMAAVAIGAIFSSTPAEFGVNAVLDRYDIIKPRVLFTIDAYRYNGKEHDVSERAREVVRRLGGIEHVVCIGHLNESREPSLDSLKGYPDGPAIHTWHGFLGQGNDAPKKIDFARMPFNHPMWIVFSSGTTGKPKSIMGPGGGVMLMRKLVYTVHFNMDHRDSYLQFATMGWIVWNMHIMWTTIGGTVVAYDGSPFYPQEVLWRLIEKYKVTQLGASPRYLQTLDKDGFKPSSGRDVSSLAQIYTTGAPVTPTVYEYIKREIPWVFLNNASGGTELGGSALQSNHTMPMYKGELMGPVLGVDVIAAAPDGRALAGEEGTMVFRSPFPNMPYEFAGNPKESRERYVDTYFSDWTNPPMFNMNDSVYLNPETRGWNVLGRADGVLNPSGVRFGSSELYYIIEKDFGNDIEDSIAVGQKMGDDERVLLFIKTIGDKPLSPELTGRLKKAIANGLSRRHVPEIIAQCPGVPVTATGKKLEPSVKKIVNGVSLAKINRTGVANPELYPWFEAWTTAHSGKKQARL